jgi:hypothetical protein
MPENAPAQLAIETRFGAQWTDDSVVLRYENDPRKKPTGPYIQLFIRSGRAVEMGFSGNKILYRRPGWIVAQCFILPKEGTQTCRIMADAVIAIFEGQQFSGITFRESEVVEIGINTAIKSVFWQANAKVFFDHDFERSY